MDNPAFKRTKLSLPSVDELVNGILHGDLVLLGKAITMVESQLPAHRNMAAQVIEACLPHAGKSKRIGITGVPGVGKSTFIEQFGIYILHEKTPLNTQRLAVLAIDPSSQISQGSILGDKTRMERLSVHPRAFVRPSPARASLGGVAQNTRESIILCEAAGFDTILVETVGVGQSETAVHSMTDLFLLLLLPGAGDELQGIKRGIVEMADILVINKADGDNIDRATQAQREYRNALHLFPARADGWSPSVLRCSALNGEGVDKLSQKIAAFFKQATDNGYFEQKRAQQAQYWLESSIQQRLLEDFNEHPWIKANFASLLEAVKAGKTSPFLAADELVKHYRHDG